MSFKAFKKRKSKFKNDILKRHIQGISSMYCCFVYFFFSTLEGIGKSLNTFVSTQFKVEFELS